MEQENLGNEIIAHLPCSSEWWKEDRAKLGTAQSYKRDARSGSRFLNSVIKVEFWCCMGIWPGCFGRWRGGIRGRMDLRCSLLGRASHWLQLVPG